MSESEDLKQKILDVMQKKSENKSKLTIKDVSKALPGEDKRKIKAAVINMTNSGEIKYWSSGSTTYIMLPEYYEKLIRAGGENNI